MNFCCKYTIGVITRLSFNWIHHLMNTRLMIFATVVSCPTLTPPPYAVIPTNPSSTSSFGTSVTITCNPGYAIDPMNPLNITIITTCTQFGNWTTFATCTGIFHASIRALSSVEQWKNTCWSITSSLNCILPYMRIRGWVEWRYAKHQYEATAAEQRKFCLYTGSSFPIRYINFKINF